MIFGDKSKITPHEAHELFWLFFELNVVPMATWSFDGKFINVNQALLDLIGYSKEEFEENRISWAELTPIEYLPIDEKCMEQLKSQHIAIPYEKEYLRKDGTQISVRIHSASHDLGASGKGIAIIIPLSMD